MKANENKWLVLGIFGIIIVFIAGWYFGISPLVNQSSLLSDKITSARSETKSQKDKLEKMQTITDTSSLTANLQKLKLLIPKTISDSEFMGQLQTVIDSSGVTIKSIAIDSTKSTKVGSLTAYPVVITGSGNQASALSFINNLQRMNRLVVVSTITWTQAANSDSATFVISGTIYSIAN